MNKDLTITIKQKESQSKQWNIPEDKIKVTPIKYLRHLRHLK